MLVEAPVRTGLWAAVRSASGASSAGSTQMRARTHARTAARFLYRREGACDLQLRMGAGTGTAASPAAARDFSFRPLQGVRKRATWF